MRDQNYRGYIGRDDSGGAMSGVCFRCNKTRHLSYNCPNPPICYNCKDSGHMATNYPRMKENKGIKLCGFGMLG